jgi:cytochrome P450
MIQAAIPAARREGPPEDMTNRADSAAAPLPAMPERPTRPLSLLQLLKTRGVNSLVLCDEALFDEPFVERRLLGHKIFVVSDPDGIRRVLVDNFANYHRHFLMRRPIAPGLGSGMLINDGAIWQRHRRLLNPALDHRATLPDVPMMIELTEALAQRLAAHPRGEPINLGNTLSVLVTISVARVFAGTEGDAAVRPMVTGMAKFPGQRRLSDFLPIPDPLRRRTREIRDAAEAWYPLIDRLIAERQRPDYAGSRDLIWRLVHARTNDGDRLSHQEVRDEALTLALGGIETTLRPMTWVWYLLSLHPWAEERLHAELDAVLGGRAPTPDDLRQLGYMRQVIDETMRLYPPVPVMLRTAASTDEICGRRVPKGATIVVAPWIIHRHRKLWDDPDCFDPERFAADRSAARSRYAYLPFAMGPRACIGAPLAMMQLQLAVAILAQRFRFRVVPGHPIEPVGWTTLRPGQGIRVTVEKR